MRIGIFSDLHGHNFREFSHIQDNGINSRLAHQADVLESIREYAEGIPLQAILFGGDLTHLKNNVDSQVVKVMMDGLNRLAGVCPIYLLPGNHDYRLWGSEPALLDVADSLDGNIDRLDDGWHSIGDLHVYASPYTRKIEQRNARIEEIIVNDYANSIFFGHQDILGVNYGGFVVEHGLDPDMLSKKFKLSLVGHCHDMLRVRDNVISIGAPLEHNFSDEGKAHGWWVLDTNAGGDEWLQFMENKGSPKFHTVKFGTNLAVEIPGDIEKDFYRVILEGVDMPEEVKAIRNKRIMQTPRRDSSKRTSISLSDSGKDIIEKYVEARKGNLDGDKLVEVGRKYL